MRLYIFFIAFTFTSWCQSDSAKVVETFRQHIEFLADDSLKGRAPGTPEINGALQYIREQCKLAGLKPFNQHFSYSYHDQIQQATNCYAFLDNRKSKTLVIGAHYDHIGMGGELSKSFRSDHVHNGADDNASGVAMALALAQNPALKDLDVNVLFVFYSAHEIGLFGSKAFVDPFLRQKKRFRQITTLLNFDMIGRMNHAHELFVAANRPTVFPEGTHIKLVQTESNSLEQLDTAPYLGMNIAVYNFTTGMHSDYHKISDDARFINYPGMYQTLDFLLRWMRSIH